MSSVFIIKKLCGQFLSSIPRSEVPRGLNQLGLQSRLGDRPLIFQAVYPPNGTAVLKGSRGSSGTVCWWMLGDRREASCRETFVDDYKNDAVSRECFFCTLTGRQTVRGGGCCCGCFAPPYKYFTVCAVGRL